MTLHHDKLDQIRQIETICKNKIRFVENHLSTINRNINRFQTDMETLTKSQLELITDPNGQDKCIDIAALCYSNQYLDNLLQMKTQLRSKIAQLEKEKWKVQQNYARQTARLKQVRNRISHITANLRKRRLEAQDLHVTEFFLTRDRFQFDAR